MTQPHARPVEARAQLFERSAGSDANGDVSTVVTQEAVARAQARLRSGDYVRPAGELPGAAIAADFLTRKLAHNGDFSEPRPWDNFKPMADYSNAARAATRAIDSAEQNIARQQWNALSDAQREAIGKEMDALDKYTFDIYHKTAKPDTPELDKFERNLSQSVAPLEQQRDHTLHEVWKNLPEDTRLKILQRDEMMVKFKVVQ